LDYRDLIMVSLKTQLQLTKLLSFPENRVFAFWRQTYRQTDEQMDSTEALSRSRCRERRLNKQCV